MDFSDKELTDVYLSILKTIIKSVLKLVLSFALLALVVIYIFTKETILYNVSLVLVASLVVITVVGCITQIVNYTTHMEEIIIRTLCGTIEFTREEDESDDDRNNKDNG